MSYDKISIAACASEIPITYSAVKGWCKVRRHGVWKSIRGQRIRLCNVTADVGWMVFTADNDMISLKVNCS